MQVFFAQTRRAPQGVEIHDVGGLPVIGGAGTSHPSSANRLGAEVEIVTVNALVAGDIQELLSRQEELRKTLSELRRRDGELVNALGEPGVGTVIELPNAENQTAGGLGGSAQFGFDHAQRAS